MKRYIKSNYADYDDEDTLELEQEFDEKLEAKLKSKLGNITNFLTEPSVQGGFGSLFVTFVYDGENYEFEFDYQTNIEDILDYGVDKAAEMYKDEILDGMRESGVIV